MNLDHGLRNYIEGDILCIHSSGLGLGGFIRMDTTCLSDVIKNLYISDHAYRKNGGIPPRSCAADWPATGSSVARRQHISWVSDWLGFRV